MKLCELKVQGALINGMAGSCQEKYCSPLCLSSATLLLQYFAAQGGCLHGLLLPHPASLIARLGVATRLLPKRHMLNRQHCANVCSCSVLKRQVKTESVFYSPAVQSESSLVENERHALQFRALDMQTTWRKLCLFKDNALPFANLPPLLQKDLCGAHRS